MLFPGITRSPAMPCGDAALSHSFSYVHGYDDGRVVFPQGARLGCDQGWLAVSCRVLRCSSLACRTVCAAGCALCTCLCVVVRARVCVCVAGRALCVCLCVCLCAAGCALACVCVLSCVLVCVCVLLAVRFVCVFVCVRVVPAARVLVSVRCRACSYVSYVFVRACAFPACPYLVCTGNPATFLTPKNGGSHADATQDPQRQAQDTHGNAEKQWYNVFLQSTQG